MRENRQEKRKGRDDMRQHLKVAMTRVYGADEQNLKSNEGNKDNDDDDRGKKGDNNNVMMVEIMIAI